MRRTLATAGTVLLLSMVLTGCGGDSGAKAGSKATSSAAPTGLPTDLPTDLPTGLPTDLASCLPTEVPSDLPTELPSELASCLPTNLPTDLPTDVPTDVPSSASGGPLDACAVVTPALIQADFGATTGQALGQPSSFGDPNAKDCYYVGGEATIVIQATTRADQDLSESAYSYAGLPGAEPIKGATRGWAYVFPGQDGADTITSGLILVKGQVGMNLAITIDGHPYTNANLQKLAQDILPGL